jgi:hypothetical protein
MNHNIKSEDQNIGLKRRIFRKQFKLASTDITVDESLRPTKSFSGVRSILPTKVAPKSLLGNIKKG